MLEWNVLRSNWNSHQIEPFNVFDHGRFYEGCKKNAKKNAKDKEAFAEQLRKDLMYYYWSKCEWEVIIDHWPHNDRFPQKKIDVFDQVSLNWEKFVDYTWEHAVELRRRERKSLQKN